MFKLALRSEHKRNIEISGDYTQVVGKDDSELSPCENKPEVLRFYFIFASRVNLFLRLNPYVYYRTIISVYRT